MAIRLIEVIHFLVASSRYKIAFHHQFWTQKGRWMPLPVIFWPGCGWLWCPYRGGRSPACPPRWPAPPPPARRADSTRTCCPPAAPRSWRISYSLSNTRPKPCWRPPPPPELPVGVNCARLTSSSVGRDFFLSFLSVSTCQKKTTKFFLYMYIYNGDHDQIISVKIPRWFSIPHPGYTANQHPISRIQNVRRANAESSARSEVLSRPGGQ